jgi:hypothetical protein
MKHYKKKSKKFNENNIKYTKDEAILLGIEDDEFGESYNDDASEDINSLEEDSDIEDVEDKKFTSSDYDKKIKKKADKEKFYVNPKEFDDEIILYYDNGIISDNLAGMLAKISHKLSYAPNFINYSYREEMVGDGIIRMFKALITKKYSHGKGNNPFSYFTRIAFNAFRNRIKKEKRIHEAHQNYKEEYILLSEPYTNMIHKNNNGKKNNN